MRRSRERVLMPAAALLSLSCAGPQSERASGSDAVSLAVGRFGQERLIGGTPCPDDAICPNVIVDVRMRDLQTLSGPSVPSSLTVRLEIHAPPAPGALLVLLVRPGARERHWQGQWVAAARPGRDVCIPASRLEEHGLPLPRGARMIGYEACFPI